MLYDATFIDVSRTVSDTAPPQYSGSEQSSIVSTVPRMDHGKMRAKDMTATGQPKGRGFVADGLIPRGCIFTEEALLCIVVQLPMEITIAHCSNVYREFKEIAEWKQKEYLSLSMHDSRAERARALVETLGPTDKCKEEIAVYEIWLANVSHITHITGQSRAALAVFAK